MSIQTRVLLIEDNVLDAKFVQSALLDDIDQAYQLDWVTSLASALDIVVKRNTDIHLSCHITFILATSHNIECR